MHHHYLLYPSQMNEASNAGSSEKKTTNYCMFATVIRCLYFHENSAIGLDTHKHAS